MWMFVGVNCFHWLLDFLVGDLCLHGLLSKFALVLCVFS